MKTRLRRAFTIAELVITVSIMVVLTAMVMRNASRMRATYQTSICQSNQRQIGLLLQLYYNKHGELPDDDEGTLREPLAGFVNDPQLFKCPRDDDPNSADSYHAYYVRRRDLADIDGSEYFLLGCPRHRSGVSSFTNSRSTVSSLGTVLTSEGATIDQAASVAERTIHSGGLQFADGSTVTIKAGGAGYGVTPVQSFRLADGSLYTVVRVKGDGEIDVSVTPGSRFEIVTPSALIGVRGTEFTVVTANGGYRTECTVNAGEVVMKGRDKGKRQREKEGKGKTRKKRKARRLKKGWKGVVDMERDESKEEYVGSNSPTPIPPGGDDDHH